MFSRFFKKKKEDKIEIPKEVFIDPINPDIYEEEDIIVANQIENYPVGLRDCKTILKNWHINEGDFVRKNQVMFTIEVEQKYGKPIRMGGKSPVNGIIIKKAALETILRDNQNCCVIRPLKDSELNKHYYDFEIKEGEKSFPKSGHIQIPFREVSSNEHKTSTTINIFEDEFSGQKTIETSSIRTESFRDEVELKISFQKENENIFLVFTSYRKHFKWRKGSLVYLLFQDKSKFCLEIENEGERYDKDSDGVIFRAKVILEDELLEKFCTEPFEKWKLENKDENKEIMGGKGSDYWGEDYWKRGLLITARGFKEFIKK